MMIPLMFWDGGMSIAYGFLSSKLAREVFAIPTSTIALESAFSIESHVLDAFRSSLTHKMVETLICTQDWLRASFKPFIAEEKLDQIEKLENGNN